jgi:hypothetical protein
MSNSNEYMREYMKNQYNSRVRLAKQILGGKCAVCETTEDLQIDHIDWVYKSMTVTQMCRATMEKFLTELGKCQLLCGTHHRQKSRSDVIERRAARGWANQYGSARASLGSKIGECTRLLPEVVSVRI